jgi:hypothetical protein
MDGAELEAIPCSSLDCRCVHGYRTHLHWCILTSCPSVGVDAIGWEGGASSHQAVVAKRMLADKDMQREDWLRLGSGRTGDQSLGLNGPCSSRARGTV